MQRPKIKIATKLPAPTTISPEEMRAATEEGKCIRVELEKRFNGMETLTYEELRIRIK